MGRWKDRLVRLGKANEDARLRYLRSLTPAKAIEVLEGILRNMPHPPTPPNPEDGPESRRKVSLGHLLRRLT